MTQEEKAKAYDEALERAKNIYNCDKTSADVEIACESIFPELKESEDERIKKGIYNALKYLETELYWDALHNGVDILDAITWLEKQGEQKPTVDKVEPKFHEGEWLCVNEPNNYAHLVKIIKVVDVFGKERYKVSRDYDSDLDVVECDFIEKNYHLWTIQDAKDGDVLVTNKKHPFIFNGHYDEDTDYIYAHCGISDLVKDNSFYCDEEGVEEELKVWCTNENIFPATKEQRDCLFQKMKEAGYEWIADKKELKRRK